MPGKIAVAHHSIADWDFQHGDTYRSLSPIQYVSAPTSLRFLKAGGAWSNAVLCRIPATQCLPQGEVRNWTFTGYSTKYPAVFRNQAALGSADYLNCYFVSITTAAAYLARYIAGVPSQRDTTPCLGYYLQWVHYRIFWYNGKTPGDVPALCVDVYLEIDGQWIKQGSTMYDTDNSWKDSAVNRSGFLSIAGGNLANFWDDTEIWGPV
ncbi:hypothetical protein ES703_50008 [subsurface metagenome]